MLFVRGVYRRITVTAKISRCGLLLREAVDRAHAPDQILGADGHDAARGEEALEG